MSKLPNNSCSDPVSGRLSSHCTSVIIFGAPNGVDFTRFSASSPFDAHAPPHALANAALAPRSINIATNVSPLAPDDAANAKTSFALELTRAHSRSFASNASRSASTSSESCSNASGSARSAGSSTRAVSSRRSF